MGRQLTKEQALLAATRLHDDIWPEIRRAERMCQSVLSDMGPRDINNQYLYDDATTVVVLADLLGKSISSFVKSIDTVRFPDA